MYQKDPEKEQRPRACMKKDIARDGDSKRWSACLGKAETGDFDFPMVALALQARNLYHRITWWDEWTRERLPVYM